MARQDSLSPTQEARIKLQINNEGNNMIDDKGIRILVNTSWNLEELFLDDNEIDTGAARWLSICNFPLH